jgi:hypothetical protein
LPELLPNVNPPKRPGLALTAKKLAQMARQVLFRFERASVAISVVVAVSVTVTPCPVFFLFFGTQFAKITIRVTMAFPRPHCGLLADSEIESP